MAPRLASRVRRAFSLVEILVVVVILAILAAFLMPHYLGGSKTAGGRRIESPKERGQGVACMNNLQQIRMGLSMSGMGGDEESRPKSLTELKLPAEMLRCPVGGEPYQYDPKTGRVWCTHPGHEQFVSNGG